jgi:DNA-binding Lrp family transcriptional regulator
MASVASQRTAATVGSITQARVTGRLAMAFLLDVVEIVRGRRDLIDALLLSTILQSNLAPVGREPELQLAFDAEAAPSDDLRRPVSLEAVAQALRLPIETVRHRVQRLAQKRLCQLVEGGVIVPTAALMTPERLKSSFAGYERLRAFYYELRDLGILPDLPPPSVELSAEIAPLRAVARLATDYVLGVVETVMGALGDPVEGLILLTVVRCNIEQLSADQRGGEGAAPQDFVTDELRRPVRVGIVARRLGLAKETVRRHAARLVERGLCVKARGGLVAPAQALARPDFLACMAGALINLHRMFAALAQLGVLRAWDDLNPARPPPRVAGIPQNG